MNSARTPSIVTGFGLVSLAAAILLLCVIIAKTSPGIFTVPAQNGAKITTTAPSTNVGTAADNLPTTAKAGKGSLGGNHKAGGRRAHTSKSSASVSSTASAPTVALSAKGAQEVAVPTALPQQKSSPTNPAAQVEKTQSKPRQSEQKKSTVPTVIAKGKNVGATYGSNSPVSIGKEIEVQSHNGDKQLFKAQTGRARALSASWNGVLARNASVSRTRHRSHKVRHRRKRLKKKTTNDRPSVSVQGSNAGGSSGEKSPVTVGSKDVVQSDNNSPTVTGSAPGVGGVNSGVNSGSDVSGSGNGSTNSGTDSGSVNNGSGDSSTASGEDSVGSITGSNGAGGSSSTTVTTTINSTTKTNTNTVTSTNNNEQTAGQTEENTVTTNVAITNE